MNWTTIDAWSYRDKRVYINIYIQHLIWVIVSVSMYVSMYVCMCVTFRTLDTTRVQQLKFCMMYLGIILSIPQKKLFSYLTKFERKVEKCWNRDKSCMHAVFCSGICERQFLYRFSTCTTASIWDVLLDFPH